MHPILLEFGRFRLYSYGALIAIGGVLSCAFLSARRARMGIAKEERFWLLVNVLLFGGFIGGRLLYLAEYVSFSRPDFWTQVLSVNKGFSVLGAFVGVVGGIFLYCRRLKLEFLRLLDYVCQAAPFWHAFGRLGCFAAGCCYGRPPGGELPWAVVFTDRRSLVAPDLLGRPLHPAQLYEAAGDLAIAALLYRFVLLRIEAGRLRPGTLCAAYFAAYGLLRFFLEYLRGDTVPSPIALLTAGQALSLGLIAAGALIFAATNRKPCIPS